MEALWRNWIARATSNRKVVGSSPTRVIRLMRSYRFKRT